MFDLGRALTDVYRALNPFVDDKGNLGFNESTRSPTPSTLLNTIAQETGIQLPTFGAPSTVTGRPVENPLAYRENFLYNDIPTPTPEDKYLFSYGRQIKPMQMNALGTGSYEGPLYSALYSTTPAYSPYYKY